MTKNEMLSEQYAHLRRQAEKRVKQWSNGESHTYENVHQVIYELKIHLAEQEIQNEGLKLAMAAQHGKEEARLESIRCMFWPLN